MSVRYEFEIEATKRLIRDCEIGDVVYVPVYGGMTTVAMLVSCDKSVPVGDANVGLLLETGEHVVGWAADKPVTFLGRCVNIKPIYDKKGT